MSRKLRGRLADLERTPLALGDLERRLETWLATPGADDVMRALARKERAEADPETMTAARRLAEAVGGRMNPQRLDEYPDTWLAAVALAGE